MRRSAGKKLIILFAALCVLVIFACVSVSKFVLTDKKELVGVYTDFVLSHDGNGQTAVIKKDNATSSSYTGYIAVTISNFTDEKVSKRDVKFSLRTPTDEEINAGFVVDAWENKHNVDKGSGNYEVTIVDENDDVVTEDSDVTLLKSNERNSSVVLLKITRKANASSAMPEDGSEQLSIILQTSRPYKDLQVFTINTTMSRLSMGVFSDVYNGHSRKTVNLKSAAEFVRSAGYLPYRAKVEFAIDGEAVFDYARYDESYETAPRLENGKWIVTIRPGADVNLYFYVYGSCTVTVSATVDDGKTDPVSEKISGTANDGTVFSE